LGLHPFGHFTFDDICDFREYYKAAPQIESSGSAVHWLNPCPVYPHRA